MIIDIKGNFFYIHNKEYHGWYGRYMVFSGDDTLFCAVVKLIQVDVLYAYNS